MNNKTLSLKNKIENIIYTKSSCTFDRNHMDERIFGFPLRVSDELCLLSYIYDFLLDGYEIIRLRDLKSIRVNTTDEFHQTLMRKQGLINEKLCFQSPLSEVETLHDVLETIVKNDEIIIIECEKKEEFYIGKVKKVNKSYILFHNFDAIGNWGKEYDKISIESITLVSLRSRYINVFTNYYKNSL